MILRRSKNALCTLERMMPAHLLEGTKLRFLKKKQIDENQYWQLVFSLNFTLILSLSTFYTLFGIFWWIIMHFVKIEFSWEILKAHKNYLVTSSWNQDRCLAQGFRCLWDAHDLYQGAWVLDLAPLLNAHSGRWQVIIQGMGLIPPTWKYWALWPSCWRHMGTKHMDGRCCLLKK